MSLCANVCRPLQFVTIMLIECDPAESRSIESGMLGVPGVQAAVQHTQPWLSDDDVPRCKDGVHFTGHLRATGPDRPGSAQLHVHHLPHALPARG